MKVYRKRFSCEVNLDVRLVESKGNLFLWGGAGEAVIVNISAISAGSIRFNVLCYKREMPSASLD